MNNIVQEYKKNTKIFYLHWLLRNKCKIIRIKLDNTGKLCLKFKIQNTTFVNTEKLKMWCVHQIYTIARIQPLK